MCVVRVVQRALGMTGSDFERTVESESRQSLAGRLKAVASWLAQYKRMRLIYIGVSGIVKQKADIVVDGMRPVDEIAQQVLDAIKGLEKQ